MKYYFFNDWQICCARYSSPKLSLYVEGGTQVHFEIPQNVDTFLFLDRETFTPTVGILGFMTYVQRSDV